MARRGKFLEMPWLAFPASSSNRGLVSWLEYFVLEWLQRSHGGSWRSPDKPCRGVLQLPVHKFGILGYPYSSTPTEDYIIIDDTDLDPDDSDDDYVDEAGADIIESSTD